MFDIILFVIITAVLVYKLYSVLGKGGSLGFRTKQKIIKDITIHSDVKDGSSKSESRTPLLSFINKQKKNENPATSQDLFESAKNITVDFELIPELCRDSYRKFVEANSGFRINMFLESCQKLFESVFDVTNNPLSDQAAIKNMVSNEIYQRIDSYRAYLQSCADKPMNILVKVTGVSVSDFRSTNEEYRFDILIRSLQISYTEGKDGTIVSGSKTSQLETADTISIFKKISSNPKEQTYWIMDLME